jgi:hypothetical protein
MRKRDHVKERGVYDRILLKRIFKKWNGGGHELIWLRIRTDGGLL